MIVNLGDQIVDIPFLQIVEVRYEIPREDFFVDRTCYNRYHNERIDLTYEVDWDDNRLHIEERHIYKSILKSKNEEFLIELFQGKHQGTWMNNNRIVYRRPKRFSKLLTLEPIKIINNKKMERNTIDEMLEILTAYKQGKEIEYYMEDDKEWCWNDSPIFNFEYTYRIKPQPKVKKLVPFTYEDELLGKCIKHKTTNEKSIIIEQGMSGVLYGTHSSHYKYLLDYYTFLDGSPCGKYIEE